MPDAVWLTVAAAGEEAARIAGFVPVRERDPESDDAKMRELTGDHRKLSSARSRARDLLLTHRPVMSAVATELSARRRLDGIVLMEVIDRATRSR